MNENPRRMVYFEPSKLFPNEEWLKITDKIVPNIKPYYIISNYGRVYNYVDQRFLAPMDGTNHLACHIRSTKNGRSVDNTPYIQRLMMTEFNYNPDYKNLEVDHIDNCSYNNIIENMQWLTREENIRKSFNNPYDRRYDKATMNFHSIGQIKKVCQLLQDTDLSFPEIEKTTGVNKSTVSSIKRRIIHTDISQNYNWNHRDYGKEKENKDE